MNRLFTLGEMSNATDGTRLRPLLNPLDTGQNELPPDLPIQMSVAAGALDPEVRSKVQVHPFVSVIVWVIEGTLEIRMHGPLDSTEYNLTVQAEEAVLAEPGTVFQLINPSSLHQVRLLYLVSPPYVFHEEEGRVIYEDAQLFDQSWEELAERNWTTNSLTNLAALAERRRKSIERLSIRGSESKKLDGTIDH